MRFTRTFAGFIISLVISSAIPAFGDPDIPSEKEQAIRKLMELTGAGDLGAQVSQQLLGQMRPAFPQVPESAWVEFAELLNPAELTQLAIPIYDRHFTMGELQALIDFYTTPVGQQVVKKLPIVEEESIAIGQQWGQTKALEILQRLADQGYQSQPL